MSLVTYNHLSRSKATHPTTRGASFFPTSTTQTTVDNVSRWVSNIDSTVSPKKLEGIMSNEHKNVKLLERADKLLRKAKRDVGCA